MPVFIISSTIKLPFSLGGLKDSPLSLVKFELERMAEGKT